MRREKVAEERRLAQAGDGQAVRGAGEWRTPTDGVARRTRRHGGVAGVAEAAMVRSMGLVWAAMSRACVCGVAELWSVFCGAAQAGLRVWRLCTWPSGVRLVRGASMASRRVTGLSARCG